MKRVLSIIVMLALAVTLFAGCAPAATTATTTAPAKEGETTAATTEKTGEPVKLVIAARGGSHVDAITAVKEKFEKENNAVIEILGLEAADLKQKVSLDAKNKSGSYDLAMADDPWMPEWFDAGIFLNLTKAGYAEDSDFVKNCLDIGKNPYGTGDIFALPFSGNVQFFFYNTKLFTDNKLDVPTDWQSVLDIAGKINGKDGKVGYVIRGQQGNPIVTDYLPIFWAFGGQIFDSNWNTLIDSQAGKDSLAFYIKLLAAGANYEKNDIVASVSDGKAAMSLGWPSWFIAGSDAKAAYAPIPNKMNSTSSAYGTGMIGNWMMGVTANSAHPELATKLLQYLVSAESQSAMTAKGGVPTRTSVLTNADLVSKYPYFPTLLEGTKNSIVRPRTPKWSDVEAAYGAELSAAISGTKTVDQALADAKKAIEDIMK